MKFSILTSVLFALALPSLAILPCLRPSTPFWNDLKTTFTPTGVVSNLLPFFPSKGYSSIPRTKDDAINKGWVGISTTCNNVDDSFQGFRYVLKLNETFNDNSVAALYDVNGIIAGIQMNILVSEAQATAKPSSDATGEFAYKFDQIPMFIKNTIDSVEYYTLTAYFVNPSTICSTGRTSAALTSEGTGPGPLYFQNGKGLSNLITAPMTRSDALAQGWSNNECFPGMGVHNWYKQEQFGDTNCTTILPAFLLYNCQQKLHGFGFQHVGKSTSPSGRFEYPPSDVVKMIVGNNVSQCLLDRASDPGVTTMHVFMIACPALQVCPCLSANLPVIG